MTEMLISSPRVHADVKDGELVLQILNKNWGGEGDGRKSKILKSEKLFDFSSTLQSKESLFYLSVQHLPYFR